MKSELAQIEVELALLRYGESTVIKALSAATGSSEDELLNKIKTLREKKIRIPKTPQETKQPIDIAQEVIKGSANEDKLLKLASFYQNRQFLPQLRDVRRFLGRFSIDRYPKSRTDATKLVFECLNKCSDKELNDLIMDMDTGGQSSFATLANHIMKPYEDKSIGN